MNVIVKEYGDNQVTRSVYKRNKAKAVFINTDPTMTDQSQAGETDVNVIVKKYGITGTAKGSATPPMYGDFSEIPSNLRDMMETARKVPEYQANLPEPLRGKPLAEILALTPEALKKILTPEPTPAPTPTPTEDKK